jgi:crotonobetainyl-CoA:carnitine CoA-transferase CaiB-like acyl-CoA transferase
MIQGMSGIMDLTGEPDRPPQKIGVAFADIFTGLYGVVAIQAALAQRQRTGLGQAIDMSLFDCMTGVLANQAMNYLASGAVPTRLGNAHPNIAPYQTFQTSDGYAVIACGNDAQFARLCTALDLEDLPGDVRFFTNLARVANRDDLSRAIESRTSAMTRDAVLAALDEAGVPAGPIKTVAEVFADPQFAARGMAILPDGIPGLRTPLTFSASQLALGRRAPRLGEHTAEIAGELERDAG